MRLSFKEADRDQFEIVWKKNISSADKKSKIKWKFWRDETHYSIMRNDLKLWIALDQETPIAQLYTVYKDKENLSKTNGKTVYLRSFDIDDAYKGQGIFSKFIKNVLSRLKNNGYTHARVSVETDDATNQKIYNHWGFTNQIAQNITIDINGEEKTVYLLEKEL